MTNLAHSYAAIEKADKNPDGTLTVYGKATDDSVDIDQQICDESWLKRAMPDWMLAGGNVREQHSNIAAGVATDYERKSDGHYITALVVDPVSVKKVETGVLKGFSIGIRSPRVIRDEKAAGGRIIDGQIVEVSLVDRPANPNAKLMLAKAAEGGELMAVEQNDVVEEMKDQAVDAVAEAADNIEATVEDVAETVADKIEEVAGDIADKVEEVADAIVDAVEHAEEIIVDAISGDGDADKAADLLNIVKSFKADLDKFDQATFDRARTELSNLIIVEAKEMADGGHDEKDSIEHLLDAIKHLFRWYEGEVAEGEVAGVVDEPEIAEDIFLAADSETESGVCEDCGEEMKLCKCNKEVSADKTVEIDDATTVAIVEKAVAQAKESVEKELESFKAALEAERAKAVDLADELATAKKAVAAGGPKRVGRATAEIPVNTLLQKAAEYRLKADATNDQTLAQGYRELAADFDAKASRKEMN